MSSHGSSASEGCFSARGTGVPGTTWYRRQLGRFLVVLGFRSRSLLRSPLLAPQAAAGAPGEPEVEPSRARREPARGAAAGAGGAEDPRAEGPLQKWEGSAGERSMKHQSYRRYTYHTDSKRHFPQRQDQLPKSIWAFRAGVDCPRCDVSATGDLTCCARLEDGGNLALWSSEMLFAALLLLVSSSALGTSQWNG